MARKTLTMMGALLILLGALANSANAAQRVCGGRDSVSEKLQASYDEQPTAIGLASSGSVLEIFTSPTGTWTIVMTQPDGVSCLMAVGEHWEAMSRKLSELES